MTDLNVVNDEDKKAAFSFFSKKREDFDYWEDYFVSALNGLVMTPEVATWNEVRLVEKARFIADEALKVRNEAEDRLS